MVYTDLMGRVSTLSKWVICASLLILNLGTQLNSQTLVCDGQINVSLGNDCNSGAQITPDMILQGMVGGNCDYQILIAGNGLNSSSDVANGDCYAEVFVPGNYSVTITSGNNSCWGRILAEDKLGPQIDCNCNDPMAPCDLPSICNGVDDNTVLPPAATDCDGVSHHSFIDVVDIGDCGEMSFLTRKWTFVDNVGNVSTCTQYYQASSYEFQYDVDGNLVDGPNDNMGIECPVNEVNVPCGSGLSPDELYKYFYGLYRDTYPPSDPITSEYLLNNHVYATRHAYPYLIAFDGMSISGATILNGSECNLFTTYTDINLAICDSGPDCAGDNKVIREWKIYDWCSPTEDPFICSQVIKAADTEAPDIEVKDFGSSVDPWGCTATVYFPKPGHIIDNCSPRAALQYVVSTGSGTTSLYGTPTGSGTGLGNVIMGFDDIRGCYFAENVPVGEHEFYYNAWDCCANIASEPVIVTVRDATPPVAITKQDVVVSLIPNPGDPNQAGITKIFAESIDNGSFDGCGSVKLEVRRDEDSCDIPYNTTYNDDGHSFDDSDDIDDGRFVQFCCNDLAENGIDEDNDGVVDYAQIKVWLRVWDDGDGDGRFGTAGDNFSEVWSWVRLEDKSRPTILCPGNVTVDCDGDPFNVDILGRASAYNSCGTMVTDYEDISTDLANCNTGTVVREWYVVGNRSINCRQTITKTGSTASSITVTFPEDRVITCDETIDEVPTWIAGACDQMSYNVDRDTFYFQDGACYKILNYWTVINWCDYQPNNPLTAGIWDTVQVVKIIDETAPVIDCPTNTVEATLMGTECSGPVMLTASATDSGVCASNRLTWEAQVDLYNDWNIDYTYSSYNNPSGGFYIPASASGEEVKITVPEGAFGEHRVEWKVSDGCRNTTTCSYTFTIADNVPPTPYCVNLSTSLTSAGSVELWACDFDLGAFDNCTPQDDLRYTFTSVSPENDDNYNPLAKCSAMAFDCDDIVNPNGTIVTLDVYVWDINGNSDFCSVFLTLVDNHASCDTTTGSRNIAGYISTEKGESIENVEVQLMVQQPEVMSVKMTDTDGKYVFEANKEDRDYEISGTKNDDYLNGVSTIDLVKIQRHILGIEKLESPYKLIAADINNDEVINGIDLVELRKLILGVYAELPQNDSWKFINSSSEMQTQYPWPLSELRVIYALEEDMMKEDFIGVKIGDVNDSATLATTGSVTTNDNNPVILGFDDRTYQAGEIVEVDVRINNGAELAGLQFAMDIQGLSFKEITGQDIELNETNYALLSDEKLSFSWNTLYVSEIEKLFKISFIATQDGSLSESIALSSDVVNSEAYTSQQLTLSPVILTGQNNPEQNIVLYQNTPNPFSNNTDVSFYLNNDNQVDMEITDVTGKQVWTQTNTFSKGLHTVNVDLSNKVATGVLYFKLSTSKESSTMKMIVLK